MGLWETQIEENSLHKVREIHYSHSTASVRPMAAIELKISAAKVRGVAPPFTTFLATNALVK